MFLSVILFLSFAQAQQEMIDCNYEQTAKKFCENMKAKEKEQNNDKLSPLQFSNGRMPSRNALKNSSADFDKRNPKLTKAEHERLTKLHEEVKKYLAESITKGREEKDLSAEEKNLLARLKMLTVSDFSNPKDEEVCRKNYNYGFDTRSYKLIVCPVMLDYPDSSLVWAMGAFSGRTLASCLTSFDMPDLNVKSGKGTLSRIAPDKHPFNLFCHSGGCEKDKGLVACLKKGNISDSTGVDLSSSDAQATVDNLIRSGLQDKSMKLPVRKSEEVALKDPKNIEWSKNMIESHKACYPEITGYRLDSGVQDWFGSEVTARYLQDHPLVINSPEDRLQPMAAIIDYTCRMDKAEEMTRKWHAPNEQRFNSAIFTNKSFREAMNCNPQTSIKENCGLSSRGGVASSPKKSWSTDPNRSVDVFGHK